MVASLEAGRVDQALIEYEGVRSLDGADPNLLAEVAAAILEEGAKSDDERVRRHAFSQLIMAGQRGLAVIDELAVDDVPVHTMARALKVQAARGNDNARSVLFGLLDNSDPDIIAMAVYGVPPETDTDRLLELVRHPSPGVRSASANILGRAAPDSRAFEALAAVSRVDPEAGVRATAIRALGRFDARAFEAIRERLSDPSISVRLSSVGALYKSDPSQARITLGSLLEAQLSETSIEAARVLAREASEGAGGATTARAVLRQALLSERSSFRAQAGIALSSLPADDSLDATILSALSEEIVPQAKLQLARALRKRHRGSEEALAAMEGLMREGGLVGVQAAALLSKDGNEQALDVLDVAMDLDDPLLRRVAARALARDARQPDRVRRALRDEDPVVRMFAAGGILAAATDG